MGGNIQQQQLLLLLLLQTLLYSSDNVCESLECAARSRTQLVCCWGLRTDQKREVRLGRRRRHSVAMPAAFLPPTIICFLRSRNLPSSSSRCQQHLLLWETRHEEEESRNLCRTYPRCVRLSTQPRRRPRSHSQTRRQSFRRHPRQPPSRTTATTTAFPSSATAYLGGFACATRPCGAFA